MLRRALLRLFQFLALAIAATKVVEWWTEAWWFEETGYSQIYFKLLAARGLSFLIGALLCGAILVLNLALARRAVAASLLKMRLDDAPHAPLLSFEDKLLLDRYRGWTIGSTVVLASWLAGLIAASPPHALHWHRLANALPIGSPDPIFGRDLSFYLFQLPALNFAWSFLFAAGVLALCLSLGLYSYEGLFGWSGGQRARQAVLPAPARRHVAALGAALLVFKAAGYRLSAWNLLTNQNGSFVGIGYTDFHWRLPILWVLTAIALVSAALLCHWAWRGEGRRVLSVPLFYFLASWLLGVIVPALAQRLEVSPNEQRLEAPYLQHHIEWTRRAYRLDAVGAYAAPRDATPRDAALHEIAAGLPAWPPQTWLDIINQSQQANGSYEFGDADVDRYVINGQARPVLIAVREATPARLDAASWSGWHLQQTHGDGLLISDASRANASGLPLNYLGDAAVPLSNLRLRRPEIFFGEFGANALARSTAAPRAPAPAASSTSARRPTPRPAPPALINRDEPPYVILNSDPTLYEARPYVGKGGVTVGAGWRQWLLAWRFADFRLALTPVVTSQSRIAWHRRVIERCRQIAPFLSYEGCDPYPVLTDDGRIVWMLDIFTVSTAMPYAQQWNPFTGGNYIRRSVQATVDAYDGTVRFYVTDGSDPLVQIYDRIFPGLFLPLQEMPRDLRRHSRYPQFLLALQAAIWGRYHDASPANFAAGKEAWELFNVNHATRQTRFLTIAALAPAATGNQAAPSSITALLIAGGDSADAGRLQQWRPGAPLSVPPMSPATGNAASEASPAILSIAPVADGLLAVQGSTAGAGANQVLSRKFAAAIGDAAAAGNSLEAMLRELQLPTTAPSSTAIASVRPSPAVNRPAVEPSSLTAARRQYLKMQQARQRRDWASYGAAEQRLGEILSGH